MGLRDSLEEFGRMKGAKTDEKGKLLTLTSSSSSSSLLLLEECRTLRGSTPSHAFNFNNS